MIQSFLKTKHKVASCCMIKNTIFWSELIVSFLYYVAHVGGFLWFELCNLRGVLNWKVSNGGWGVGVTRRARNRIGSKCWGVEAWWGSHRQGEDSSVLWRTKEERIFFRETAVSSGWFRLNAEGLLSNQIGLLCKGENDFYPGDKLGMLQ